MLNWGGSIEPRWLAILGSVRVRCRGNRGLDEALMTLASLLNGCLSSGLLGYFGAPTECSRARQG